MGPVKSFRGPLWYLSTVFKDLYGTFLRDTKDLCGTSQQFPRTSMGTSESLQGPLWYLSTVFKDLYGTFQQFQGPLWYLSKVFKDLFGTFQQLLKTTTL